MIQAQQTNILSLDVEQKMAGSEQKTSKPNQEKNPQHNARFTNQNYRATQNSGFAPKPLTQQ